MRETIEKWIASGRDYSTGVAIYAEHGKNTAYKSLFQSGKSPFTEKKLGDLLHEMLEAAKPKARSYANKPKYQVTELSPELQQEFTDKGKLYKEASALHGDMFHERDQQKRAQLREQIVKNFDRISDTWNKADAYIIRQRELNNDPVKLIQERNNIRSQISKARKKGQQDKLNSLEARLAEITQQING